MATGKKQKKAEIKAYIDKIFATQLGSASTKYPSSKWKKPRSIYYLKATKLFEIAAMCELMDRVSALAPGSASFHLVPALGTSNELHLQTSPGQADRDNGYIELRLNGIAVGSLWTNIEFLTLSYSRTMPISLLEKGNYHEGDVILLSSTPSATAGKFCPQHDEIMVLVSCKFTANLSKAFLREILGTRRELSILHDPQPSKLRVLLNSHINPKEFSLEIPGVPASHLVFAYADKLASSNPANDWKSAGDCFGIEYWRMKI